MSGGTATGENACGRCSKAVYEAEKIVGAGRVIKKKTTPTAIKRMEGGGTA